MEAQNRETPRDRLEQWAALLLAAATVATAFSAYQATRWSGEQSTKFTQAGAARTESAKAEGKANNLLNFDQALFAEYSTALYSPGDTEVIRSGLRDQFRDEFKPAFSEWLQGDPGESPFELDSYKLEKQVEADKLESNAQILFELGREANENSDKYVLSTIFFAAVLFFAGIAGTFRRDQLVKTMLIFGCIVFAGGLIRVGTLPLL